MEHEKTRMSERGQLLIEVGIAISVVATLAAITSTLIVVAQRNQISARRQDAASSLMAELYSIVGAVANSDSFTSSSGFNRLYCPPNGVCPSAEFPVTTDKGAAQPYRPILLGDRWELEAGAEAITVSGIDFTRYVTVENVCRDLSGDIVGTWATSVAADCPNGSSDSDDPSAQKLTVTLQAAQMNDLSAGLYVTRWNNSISSQTDWGGNIADESGLGETAIKFRISWSDDGANVRAFSCKTDEISGLNYTCPGGKWAETPDWVTVSPIDLYYTPQKVDIGTNNYFAFVCDDEGACSASDSGTFTVNQ